MATKMPKMLLAGPVAILLLIAPGGVVSAAPSEMHHLMAAGGANPLVAENVAGYDRLMDFVFVKKPFIPIPIPIKGVFVQEAIDHRPLNLEIFEQIRNPRNVEPLENLLRGQTVPTLILWGSQDRVLHVSGAKILEAVMPNARAVVMDGVGHIPMIEKPKETAEQVERWRQNRPLYESRQIGYRHLTAAPSKAAHLM